MRLASASSFHFLLNLMKLPIAYITDKVLASAPAGYENGSSGSIVLSTGRSNGNHESSGSITFNTGDTVGGPAGSISIEAGETVSSCM